MANKKDWQLDAIEQVEGASLPGFSGKQDAVKWFQQEYGFGSGKKGARIPWKNQLIDAILPFTKQTGKDPRKNVTKRFDPQRLNNPEPKNKREYQQLALSLGLYKAPKKGYHVHYVGGVQFSECEERDFDIDIVGEMADELAQHPEKVMQIIFLVYMQQEGEDEPSAGPCDETGTPEITITANPDNYNVPTVKRHKSAMPFLKRNQQYETMMGGFFR